MRKQQHITNRRRIRKQHHQPVDTRRDSPVGRRSQTQGLEVAGAVDFDCDDDGGAGLQSQLDLTNVPAGVYYFIVDGFTSNSGAYNLNISGVVRSGQACDSTQIAAGLVACAAGTTCQAGTCSP